MTRIDIYLGHAGHALAIDGRALELPQQGVSEEALDGLFQRVVQELPGRLVRRSARVWLSGAIARPFVFGPLDGLKRWSEVLAMARVRAAEATGLAEPCEVTVEDWPAPRATLAVAVEAWLPLALETMAKRHGIRLSSIRPWWAAAAEHLRAKHKDGKLTALVDTDALIALAWQGDAVESASAYVPLPETEAAGALLTRLALTHGIAADRVPRLRFNAACESGDASVPFADADREAAE